jgi:hypothetical protein
VQCVLADGKSETVEADLVIDASGRGTLTLGLLKASGWALPAETTIGVDLGYATAVFAMPEDAPEDWKGVFCFPQAPRSNFGALLLPMEGERWIVTIARLHGETPVVQWLIKSGAKGAAPAAGAKAAAPAAKKK